MANERELKTLAAGIGTITAINEVLRTVEAPGNPARITIATVLFTEERTDEKTGVHYFPLGEFPLPEDHSFSVLDRVQVIPVTKAVGKGEETTFIIAPQKS